MDARRYLWHEHSKAENSHCTHLWRLTLVHSAVNPKLLQFNLGLFYYWKAPQKNSVSVHDKDDDDKRPSSLQALSHHSLVCLTTTTWGPRSLFWHCNNTINTQASRSPSLYIMTKICLSTWISSSKWHKPSIIMLHARTRISFEGAQTSQGNGLAFI